MSDEITPQAKPIATTGEPEWFPPAQDDSITTHPPEPASGIRRIFFGDDGLRAGWALLLWFTFISMIGRGVSAMVRLLLNGHVAPHTNPEWLTLSMSTISFFVVAAAALVVSRIERRPWATYGIGSLRGRAGELGMGLLWGFVALSLLVGALHATGYLTFGGFNLHGGANIILWAILFALSFLMTGFFEEFAFRGFPQFTLTRGIAGILRSAGLEDRAKAVSFWITAILLAILFGAVHAGNPGEGRIGLIAAGLIGFLFAFSLWRTGSLWWAIGFHAAWDWAESYFYGTSDSGLVLPHRLLITQPQGNPLYSGGTIGPEGSIFIVVIIAIVAAIIALTLKPRPGSPSTEQ
ncbi:CAAX amino terminal protease family [Terriglobus roseus DSM 18391]|uniref:CAAX amino terminal protease family n=1 Tax=Terriglobus roseus (strain DSM 18391 / NRRL B-41598 / KBS 63) TaxID=926566 RepID=I3ZC37_TERRK|nr:CPBP family intramembrane glutamic endopeptidase [Terriglobus roseus]AFL86805.1 CAAX amino terminal protease family [Terriglobus roseus DSM 18391]